MGAVFAVSFKRHHFIQNRFRSEQSENIGAARTKRSMRFHNKWHKPSILSSRQRLILLNFALFTHCSSSQRGVHSCRLCESIGMSYTHINQHITGMTRQTQIRPCALCAISKPWFYRHRKACATAQRSQHLHHMIMACSAHRTPQHCTPMKVIWTQRVNVATATASANIKYTAFT
jgi:hypothetical protein